MKIDGRYPIMPIRLETALELAYIAPALEIVVGIIALLDIDHLCEPAKQQRECPSGTDYTDGHIMPVQDKDITVQAGFRFSDNHNQQLSNQLPASAGPGSRPFISCLPK